MPINYFARDSYTLAAHPRWSVPNSSCFHGQIAAADARRVLAPEVLQSPLSHEASQVIDAKATRLRSSVKRQQFVCASRQCRF